MQDTAKDLMVYFEKLGALRHLSPDHKDVQEIVADLQQFITEHYYHCTLTIFRSLGIMYAGGGEMTENIDAAGGEGTGIFAQQAIEIYCDR